MLPFEARPSILPRTVQYVLRWNVNKDGHGLNDLRMFAHCAQDMIYAWQPCGNSRLIGGYYIVSCDERDVTFLSLFRKESLGTVAILILGDAFRAA